MFTRPKKGSLGRIAAGYSNDRHKRSRKKKKSSHDKREKLEPGYVIFSENSKYKVIELLGSGGFGDVYKVVEETETGSKGSISAMKTEQSDSHEKRMLGLKMEARVLSDCNEREGPWERKRHFLAMVDRGRTSKFKYLLMGLVGPSIADLRKDYIKDERFSKGNSLQMAIQTLESVWYIHEVGYIHRDIKPQNFAIGLGDREDTIYMLDFGIARRFFDVVDGKMTVRPPRQRARFIGTVRFASRRCHSGREQGRMDDLEVWIYMVIDLFDPEGLPWRRMSDSNRVHEMKLQFFDFEFRNTFKYVTDDFREIVKYVDRLDYNEDPNYQRIIERLRAIGDDHKMDYTKKFRWAGKIEIVKRNKKEKYGRKDDEPSYEVERDYEEEDEESESDRQNKKPPMTPNASGKKPSSNKQGRPIAKNTPGSKEKIPSGKLKKMSMEPLPNGESVEVVNQKTGSNEMPKSKMEQPQNYGSKEVVTQKRGGSKEAVPQKFLSKEMPTARKAQPPNYGSKEVVPQKCASNKKMPKSKMEKPQNYGSKEVVPQKRGGSKEAVPQKFLSKEKRVVNRPKMVSVEQSEISRGE